MLKRGVRPGFIIGLLIVLAVIAGLWFMAYKSGDRYMSRTGGNAGTNGNP